MSHNSKHDSVQIWTTLKCLLNRSPGGPRPSPPQPPAAAPASAPPLAQEEAALRRPTTTSAAFAAAADDATAQESYGPRRPRRATGMTAIPDDK